MCNEIGTRTFLYALDKEYNILRYGNVSRVWLSIPELINRAKSLKYECPDAIGIYAIENSYDLYELCKRVQKRHLVEDRVVFKDLLETEGIKIL